MCSAELQRGTPGKGASPFLGPNKKINPLKALSATSVNTFGWGCKLYPSGEFCLYRRKKDETSERFKEAFDSAGHGIFKGRDIADLQRLYGQETLQRWLSTAAPMDVSGLCRDSTHSIEATALMGLAASVNSKKKRRGLSGLTSHGKNLVREAAYALQERYGRARLSFWTCTLPELSEEDTRNVCLNWSKILHNLRQKLVYHLKAKGLPTHIVGVTELQPDRWKEKGYPAWHIHWLFVGCHTNGGWELTTEVTDKLWADAVHTYCEKRYDFSLSCSLEGVRKTAGGYMAKYMSKGCSAALEVEALYPGCVPASWYTVTAGVRRWVKGATRTSIETAKWLYARLLNDIDGIVAPWAYKLETRPGCHIAVCWLGRIPDKPSVDYSGLDA